MTTTDPDTDRGVYTKYRVEKLNGKPIGECFVLEAHDPHAIAALRAYVTSCVTAFPNLAVDLSQMADRWHDSQLAAEYAVRCSLCRRERTLRDAYDYNPIQAITGQQLGWYSGDDGEVCPECMTKTLRGQ